MQQYQLGKYLRRRYAKILGSKYSPNKIYIRSTDIDRAIASALVNSAGMFEATDDQIWSDVIPMWQPIPIHTVPTDSDSILLSPKNCSKYDAIYEKYKNESPELKEIFVKHAKLLSFLSKQSGWNITTIGEVFQLYDVLYVERLHNKT